MGFFEDLIASLQDFVQNEPPPDWKYRKDPIFGGGNDISVDRLEQYGGPTVTDTRAKLYRDRYGDVSGGIDRGSWFSKTPLGQDLSKYTEDGKLQLPFEPGPALSGVAEKKKSDPYGLEGTQPTVDDVGRSMHERAQEKIKAREASEQEQIAREAARESEKQRLLEAAGRKNQQQEFMSGTVPLVENYDKGIAIGGDPKGGSAEDIMFRIRAEARAKGRNGSLRGGQPTEEDYYAAAQGPRWSSGALTTAADSPEIRQRLSERDAWVAEQPYRDAAFALTPQQVNRNPELAGGSEYLRRLGQDQMEGVRRERASQLIQQFVGPSGKIPADAARKLATMDPIFAQMIPSDAIGMSREQASEMIDAELMSAQQIAMSSAGDMTDMAKPIKIELVNRVYPLAAAAKQRIASGEDPELVMQEYRSRVAAINYEIMQSPAFQSLVGPNQAQPGE